MSFSDHFSSAASSYATYRPRYPAALFEWLASVSPDRGRVWDCGTGNGQAAVALAAHFARVVATDPSVAQLEHAARHAVIDYAAMAAERSAIREGSVDLVTVAQALHWFDQPAFYAEARRVLVERGVVAVWSYGVLTLRDQALDAVLHRFHRETMGPYWPPERRLVDEGYVGIRLPFEQVDAPDFAMEVEWTLQQLAGYVSTWSAVQRARAATGSDPLPALIDEVRPLWGAEGSVRAVAWPLTLRVGRV